MSRLLEKYQKFRERYTGKDGMHDYEFEKIFAKGDYDSLPVSQKNRVRIIINRTWKCLNKCVA